jgi:DNA-binding transcriptional LysR family regulator
MKDSPLLRDPTIELRLWRQFLVLAETLHFGRAAQQLAMTQPPLTQAIQQLEQRLAVPLFARSRRSVALTPAGAALVDPVRALLRQAAALTPLARDAHAGETGRLQLGFVSTVGFDRLPGWLRRLRELHPGMVVELREATTDVQLAAFAQETLDAGFVLHAPGRLPESPLALERLSIGVEPLVLALPAALPWAAARQLKVAELLAQPLVIFPREIAPSLYDAVLAFYHRHGATPVIAQQAIQMQTIVNLVSAGLGIALVPHAVTLLQRPGVVYRPLPAALRADAPQCETSLLWRVPATPAVARFVAFVREHR